ncbi:MAG TPA: DUF302 domain-containing protein [Gemmatimonadaceae bacterium]
MSQSLAYTVHVPMDFEAAAEATRTALKAEGFGVLTEIDLQATFREKLNREFRRYTILGACNPPLAYAAVTADPAVGLLLPCNVTLEELGPAATLVRLTDPRAMLSAAPGGLSPAVQDVAAEATARMERVARELQNAGAKRG